MPSSLADFTSPALIVPDLRGRDAAAVIEELSETLGRDERVLDWESFCSTAIKRELLVSTEMEAGMAFAHARRADVKEVSFALGRKKEPMRWGAGAVASVRLVFLIAVPADDSAQYLSLISGLARLAKESNTVEKLHTATDAMRIFEVLREATVRTNSNSDQFKPAGAQR